LLFLRPVSQSKGLLALWFLSPKNPLNYAPRALHFIQVFSPPTLTIIRFSGPSSFSYVAIKILPPTFSASPVFSLLYAFPPESRFFSSLATITDGAGFSTLLLAFLPKAVTTPL